jgi:hypothetical protein
VGAAGAGVSAGSGVVAEGAADSTRGEAGGVGLDGSRNPNHHVASASSSTPPITIAVVGRLDVCDTGEAVRVAVVGGRDGGSGGRTAAGRGGGIDAAGGRLGIGMAAEGGGSGSADSGANASSLGSASGRSNGLPVAAQKSLRF